VIRLSKKCVTDDGPHPAATPAFAGHLLSSRAPLAIVSAAGSWDHDLPGIEEIRSGGEAAFDALFRAFYPRLCGYVVRFTRSSEIAEELVQEIFASVWQRRSTLDPKGSLDQYLFRAARNRALKYLRQQSVRNRLRDEIEPRCGDRPPTPEEEFRYDEIAAAAQRAIDGLPERCRHIFLLSREGALSYSEIAELLEISVKTVETQMGRALKAVRASLLPYLC
jgi:RNA polymerase sigma-70 factor, ECF subfamily